MRDGVPITDRTIQALYTLSRLRKVEIEGTAGNLEVTDGALAVLARSLPLLVVFSIAVVVKIADRYEDHERLVRVLLTEASLLEISTHCRALTDLTLPVDFLGFGCRPGGIRDRGLPAANPSIKTLKLRHRIFTEDIEGVATFLARCFPLVVDFEACSLRCDGTAQVLESAQQLMAEFRHQQAMATSINDAVS